MTAKDATPGSFAFLHAAGLTGIDEPTSADELSPAQKTELMDRIYRRGDRLVTRFIYGHATLALLLATFYQTWLVTIVVMVCAVSLFSVAANLLPRSFITRCLAGVSLQIFVALHIYQLHGLAEMHFFFFTAFTMLIVYQDWKCMWPGAIGIIGQHLGFALLHNAGLGASLFFFDEGYVGITKLFFHFGIALGQVALCGYWAYLLSRQTLASAVQNAGLRALGERLGRSEGKFRALIEHALDIITIVDADGTIRYESPAVARVLGYQPDELIGRNVFELIHPDDFGPTTAAFVRRQSATPGPPTPTEFRYRHRDGSWRTLEAVASAMDASVGGIVINSRDVTERHRADDAMRVAKEDAEKANRAKSEFLSRMSHELRTPLNAILGFGQLLEMSKLQGRAAESIGHILKAGRHLLDLIDEVLAIARIEAGKMQLSLEPVSLNEITRECLALVGRQAEARRVRCHNLCADAEGGSPHVQADRQRLRQVCINLLSNAIKYNREGGRMVITCHECPAADRITPPTLRLEITDTGHGLTADEIGHLFVPFERLGAERTATEGTGLGLAVCKGLVEAMSGSIGVHSVPGEGSTFWVELPSAVDPLARLKSNLGPPALPAPVPHFEGTILYIEDNLSNLRLVEMLLESRPELLLLSAAQGRLGLELARARRPDLILLDLHLPDLPGWDVLSQLQGDERTRDIPTVIISADATPGQIARLLEAGACEYLTKPIDVARLMATVDGHLHARGSALVMAT